MAAVVLLRIDRVGGAAGHPRHLHPPLDLKIVEAGLAGQAVLLDGWRIPGGPSVWAQRALTLAPRIAVLKAASWCLDEAIDCGRRLRAAGVTTIAVGQQVAHGLRLPPAGWPEAFDLALVGEPEEALLGLIPRLLAGQAHGLAAGSSPVKGEVRRGMGRDGRSLQAHRALDESHPHPNPPLEGEGARADADRQPVEVAAPDALPWPRYTDEELLAYSFPFPLPGRPLARWAYLLTAWGCPHACRHCSAVVRKSSGQRLRKRSPERVADEVAAHLDAGAEAIAFEDDTLLVDRRHFLALCETFQRRGLHFPWIANARPDELDAERVAAAAGAGARLFKVGAETASPRLIELLGKARCGGEWRLASEQGFARLRAAGIASVGLFLVGLPTETEAEAAATLTWAQALAPDYVQVQIFRSYPDIPWWQQLAPAQRDGAGAYHYGPVAASAAAIRPERLPALQRQFYRRFYLSPRFLLDHACRYWRYYLAPAGLRAGLARLGYLAARP